MITIRHNCINDDLISLLKSLPKHSQPAATYTIKKGQSVDLEYRITNWITLPPDVVASASNALRDFYNLELKKNYKKTISNIEGPQFLEYLPGGKYEEHNDAEEYTNGELHRVCPRDLTVLIYVNDDYEGGELEFTKIGLKIKPLAKTLIAFPSYIEYSHKVHPVITGTRYSLVFWINTDETIYPRPYV